MKKVYIITSGEYSDYGIEKVFLDEAKARKYAEWHKDTTVEEYDLSDDEISIPCYRVQIKFDFTKTSTAYSQPTVQAIPTTLEGCSPSDCKFVSVTEFRRWASQESTIRLNITQYVPADEFNENCTAKYLKAAYDTAAKIQGYYAEGFNMQQINEILHPNDKGAKDED